jgi:hypothetical protein
MWIVYLDVLVYNLLGVRDMFAGEDFSDFICLSIYNNKN